MTPAQPSLRYREPGGRIAGESQRRTAAALAGWWLRVGAWLIDTAVMLVLAAVLSLVLWAAGSEARIAALVAVGAIEYGFRGLVYAPLLMSRPGPHNGQTLGK